MENQRCIIVGKFILQAKTGFRHIDVIFMLFSTKLPNARIITSVRSGVCVRRSSWIDLDHVKKPYHSIPDRLDNAIKWRAISLKFVIIWLQNLNRKFDRFEVNYAKVSARKSLTVHVGKCICVHLYISIVSMYIYILILWYFLTEISAPTTFEILAMTYFPPLNI